MKKNLLLALALVSFSLGAEIIKISRMKTHPELERSYILKTNLTEEVALDCQSFIMGLRIGTEGDAFTYMMDDQTCEKLHDDIEHSLLRFQKHCIDVESDIRSDYSCQ